MEAVYWPNVRIICKLLKELEARTGIEPAHIPNPNWSA
jgi:hypothetical protein